jgi:branched-chain amino acid transport system substrate-binding protein
MQRRNRFGPLAAVLLAFALIVAACGDSEEAGDTTAAPGTTAATTTAAPDDGSDTTAPPSTEPVAVCELAYYTGEFAAYGPSLTADVVFPVEEVINLDPPLGRPWEMYSEDLGTVGEGQAARTCLEQHNAEILVSMAHGYRQYRDYLLEYVAENDSPLGPSVHGGTIPGNLGGTGAEPIFRAQGLDEALGMTGVLYADKLGLNTVVVFATQVEGFQLAASAAEKAAEAVGIEVLARIDVPAEQPSYRAEAQRIADLAPDAVIVQAGSVESATLIKQAAEAGLSLYGIGETGWIQPEFIGTLGADAIATQKGIGYAAFSYNDQTPAWDYYEPLWDNTPGYGDLYGPATDQYHYSTYDVMIQTALAVEYGGSYNASDWAPAMHEVGSPPGEVCYTYETCLTLIRDGKDVDYEGITGSGTYTAGGVNDIVQAFYPFNTDGSVGAVVLIDPTKALEVIQEIQVEAECDANNHCEW